MRKYGLLLGGFGFSYLGNWIYLVALNLMVWHLTYSATAVAGIFIVGPVARIMTNFVAGSIIDRSNKRNIMIAMDITRGLIVFFMPFMTSIWLIYSLLFLANIASSFFGPSSTYYIAKYVQDEDKQRFNALLGTLNSGSFMLGPAIAGILIAVFNISIAIWINSVTFFVCAWVIARLPNIEEEVKEKRVVLTMGVLIADFKMVWRFIKQYPNFLKFFMAYQIALMAAFALDSQEMTFIKNNLLASDSLYGVLVSIAGVGAIVGGFLAIALVHKFSVATYIGVGLTCTMLSYTAFYAASNMWFATACFITLGVFMAFSNTGYDTVYQKNIPPHLMGRFGSSVSLVQSVIQIVLTFSLGLLADWFSLQLVAVTFGAVGLIFAVLMAIHIATNKQALHIAKENN
ncbi:MFS transporter [Lysinibacillus sp. NPDC097195]|uniref:MFS transporter n=1 Tax=Lysinibacillus sp. NPDC097195 TaxID=3364141 RepID=UPI00382BAACE